jgi:hypothetical protein
MTGAHVAAHAAAVANAIKAFGTVVRVSPEEFRKVLNRCDDGLVVTAEGGVFTTKHLYLLGYKGFVFFCRSPEPIEIPRHLEVVQAESVAVPQ